MRLRWDLSWAFVLPLVVQGQITLTGANEALSSAIGDAPPPSERSYQEYNSTRLVDNSISSTPGSATASVTGAADLIGSTGSSSSSTSSVTLLVGSQPTDSLSNSVLPPNATSSQTGPTPEHSNTTPCNGHPAYCSRKFSNITQIAAHNSPFSRPGNAAANQDLDVLSQLQDGIRMCRLCSKFFPPRQPLISLKCNPKPTGTKANR